MAEGIQGCGPMLRPILKEAGQGGGHALAAQLHRYPLVRGEETPEERDESRGKLHRVELRMLEPEQHDEELRPSILSLNSPETMHEDSELELGRLRNAVVTEEVVL